MASGNLKKSKTGAKAKKVFNSFSAAKKRRGEKRKK